MSAKKSVKPISTSADWTFDLVQEYYDVIAGIAEDFELDTYPNQLEVISAEQMLRCSSSLDGMLPAVLVESGKLNVISAETLHEPRTD